MNPLHPYPSLFNRKTTIRPPFILEPQVYDTSLCSEACFEAFKEHLSTILQSIVPSSTITSTPLYHIQITVPTLIRTEDIIQIKHLGEYWQHAMLLKIPVSSLTKWVNMCKHENTCTFKTQFLKNIFPVSMYIQSKTNQNYIVALQISVIPKF